METVNLTLIGLGKAGPLYWALWAVNFGVALLAAVYIYRAERRGRWADQESTMEVFVLSVIVVIVFLGVTVSGIFPIRPDLLGLIVVPTIGISLSAWGLPLLLGPWQRRRSESKGKENNA